MPAKVPTPRVMTRLVNEVLPFSDTFIRDMCQASLVNTTEERSLHNSEYCIIASCGAILRSWPRQLSVMMLRTSFHFDNSAGICKKSQMGRHHSYAPLGRGAGLLPIWERQLLYNLEGLAPQFLIEAFQVSSLESSRILTYTLYNPHSFITPQNRHALRRLLQPCFVGSLCLRLPPRL